MNVHILDNSISMVIYQLKHIIPAKKCTISDSSSSGNTIHEGVKENQSQYNNCRKYVVEVNIVRLIVLVSALNMDVVIHQLMIPTSH